MSGSRLKSSEATPLLAHEPPRRRRLWSPSSLQRALLCGFIVSLSFGVTQVPLLYAFRIMTCDAYYSTHPEPIGSPDRCANHEIESSTARSFSLLSTSTSLFGVVNLFVTGWTIKRIGVKSALLVQVFWPAVRLAVQNVGIMTGGDAGILVIQASQVITIIGGPAGYLLALNTMITEVIDAKDRTGALGRLQGCTMMGTAIGYLLGGLISDKFSIIAPFRVTLVLFLTCSLYVLLFLPFISRSKAEPKRTNSFFGPLKIFAPQKYVLRDGRVKTQYGALLLGMGVFFGVLATGYIPVLLQMFSTDALGFGPTENGELVSLHSLLRGLFLTLIFPRIISLGRAWFERREAVKSKAGARPGTPPDSQAIPDLPSSASDFAAEVEPMEPVEEPIEPPRLQDKQETFAFDLIYTRWSLIADGILTGLATFVRQGWQIYVVAVMLSLASGTASAAKGTILQMCSSSNRPDALSAITLVEMVARLMTTTIFGLVFAAFASTGKTHLVFTCNAAVALLGFCILCLSHFPPEGSSRLEQVSDEQENRTSD